MISGGSAGGYTTLRALTPEDGATFSAGASYYGVSDLEALARDTHKFESRYLDWLIGPYPRDREIYAERSPINHADRLSAPVIFFQGSADRVVPPNQTERMVAALKARGVPVGYLLFEGEQHGFRRAETIKRALDAELYFYALLVLRSGPPILSLAAFLPARLKDFSRLRPRLVPPSFASVSKCDLIGDDG